MREDLQASASLGHLFVRAAHRHAGREAFIADGVRWSYGQLADRVGRVSRVLTDAGLGRGAALAILAPNKPDVLTVTLAAMVNGLRVTPLSALSSPSDLRVILEDAQVDALLCDAGAERMLEQIGRPRTLRHVFSLGSCAGAVDLVAAADAAPATDPVPQATGRDLGMVVYTGGTTGRPKGVVHTQESLLAAVLMATSEWEWPAEMRVMAATPVSHAAGILAYPTFLRGGVFLMGGAFSTDRFRAFVARERVTATFLVPTMIYRLLDEVPPGETLGTLETVLYGAAPIAETRLREAIRRFGPIFMQLYGQTEAPTCLTYLGRAQHDLDDPESLRSCGVPLASVQVQLEGAEGAAVGDGERGEICVRGPLLMQGYWNRPEETAEALRGGWLHTGDVGRFDAKGRLHIVDRLKDMLITGGLNVFPSEVEQALCEHSGVAAAAVCGVPDGDWGEAVCAAVVPRPGAAMDVDLLRAWVRDRKGAVHVPKQIVFLEAIPATPIGKVDRQALRSLFSRPGGTTARGPGARP